jgi:hypothetical protein
MGTKGFGLDIIIISTSQILNIFHILNISLNVSLLDGRAAFSIFLFFKKQGIKDWGEGCEERRKADYM